MRKRVLPWLTERELEYMEGLDEPASYIAAMQNISGHWCNPTLGIDPFLSRAAAKLTTPTEFIVRKLGITSGDSGTSATSISMMC